MLASTGNVLAQQGIGTNTPHRSAALQIDSQNKGILIPRINLGYNTEDNKITSTIPSPVQGLLVYNQTGIANVPEGFYYYSGGKWNPISKSYLQDSDHTTISGDGTVIPYKVELKPATASQLGGVKIGENINVDANGTISVSFPASTVDTNTITTVSKDQSYVNVDLTQTVGEGTTPINTRDYKIGVDKATADEFGVVKPGTGLTVTDGTLSVDTTTTSGIGKNLTQGDTSITVTNGLGATLVDTNIKVSDLGITTGKIAVDAVTNAKLADNAVQTENILNGTIIAEDLALKSVTAIKLEAGPGVANRLAIADATGNVTYSTISTSILTGAGNLTSVTGDNSITVSDGNGATLKNTNITVSDSGIVTEKLANNAVKTAKIADDAVTAAKINADVAGEGLIQNPNGALDVNADNGLKVESDIVKLGGALTESTTISTTTANNLKITGLDTVAQTVTPTASMDKVMIVASDGTLKQAKAVMPKFFYAPAVYIPTHDTTTGVLLTDTQTVELYNEYKKQFEWHGTTDNLTFATSGENAYGQARSSNSVNLPVLASTDLEYFVTYYDATVFSNVQINATGTMTYTVLPNVSITPRTFINVVFKVKD